MSTINSVYWEIEPHTEVKHTILKEYLNAWLPILTNHQIRTRKNDIIYIDGFAGPGKYQDGTKGSPIIAIDCLLGHYQNLIRTGVNFHYFFIEQHKERYYETLQQSSQGWHEGKHDPWPYINYLLSILKMAYKEFEDRMGRIKSPRGAKTGLIEKAVRDFSSEFSVSDLERACPSVSRDMVRRVLRDLQARGDVECLGRGPGALWRKREKR
jgi:hypothetical protein